MFDQFLQITHETEQRLCHSFGLPQPEPLVELFLRALGSGATRSSGIQEKRKRRSTALWHLSHVPIVMQRKPTMSLRHKNGTSYDGTAARNSQRHS